jgi:hypothetical protein
MKAEEALASLVPASSNRISGADAAYIRLSSLNHFPRLCGKVAIVLHKVGEHPLPNFDSRTGRSAHPTSIIYPPVQSIGFGVMRPHVNLSDAKFCKGRSSILTHLDHLTGDNEIGLASRWIEGGCRRGASETLGRAECGRQHQYDAQTPNRHRCPEAPHTVSQLARPTDGGNGRRRRAALTRPVATGCITVIIQRRQMGDSGSWCGRAKGCA